MINIPNYCLKNLHVHVVEEEDKAEALRTAVLRRKFHASFGSKRHWHDPQKGEYGDEYYGSLAHLAFEKHLRSQEVKEFKMAPLYVDNLKELPEWDVLLEGKTVELKAIPPDDKVIRKRMLVKVSEFKQLDFYVAVKFLDPDHYVLAGFEEGKRVGARAPKSFGFAPAYPLMLSELRPLEGCWWLPVEKSCPREAPVDVFGF